MIAQRVQELKQLGTSSCEFGFKDTAALHEAIILDSFARATSHHCLGRCIWWGRGGRSGRSYVLPIGRLFPCKEFFANFSCDQVELRQPIAQLISHTLCRFAAHPEEDEEAVLVVDEVALLPVEVCSSSAVALLKL
jgi:hypothetical protein